jgi:hypothetical protein
VVYAIRSWEMDLKIMYFNHFWILQVQLESAFFHILKILLHRDCTIYVSDNNGNNKHINYKIKFDIPIKIIFSG